MEKIRVDIDWCDKNFGASIVDYAGNSIVVTAKTYDELLQEIKAAWLVAIVWMPAHRY